jgi:hypothetical protein
VVSKAATDHEEGVELLVKLEHHPSLPRPMSERANDSNGLRPIVVSLRLLDAWRESKSRSDQTTHSKWS